MMLTTTLVGCASTQQKTALNQLQMQVADLERQVGEKDDEIADLQDEVDRLNVDLQKKTKMASEEAIKPLSKKDGEIIRVGASVGQVQIALKKAGYYDGAIDSKLGENTKRAIVQFQKDNNLNADGLLGKKTWEKLKTYFEE